MQLISFISTKNALLLSKQLQKKKKKMAKNISRFNRRLGRRNPWPCESPCDHEVKCSFLDYNTIHSTNDKYTRGGDTDLERGYGDVQP